MDLTEAAAPRSDQLNADDLFGGPLTVTITEVRITGGEQPVQVHTAETPGRPWKPSKGMLRVLMAAWGKDEQAFVGRRATLFREPKVKWAGQAIGGIQVSHLSHIAQPVVTSLTVAKGKREPFTVRPIPASPEPVAPSADQVAASEDEAQLRAWWGQATPEVQALIEARVKELRAS